MRSIRRPLIELPNNGVVTMTTPTSTTRGGGGSAVAQVGPSSPSQSSVVISPTLTASPSQPPSLMPSLSNSNGRQHQHDAITNGMISQDLWLDPLSDDDRPRVPRHQANYSNGVAARAHARMGSEYFHDTHASPGTTKTTILGRIGSRSKGNNGCDNCLRIEEAYHQNKSMLINAREEAKQCDVKYTAIQEEGSRLYEVYSL
jgi:hypothetical protein